MRENSRNSRASSASLCAPLPLASPLLQPRRLRRPARLPLHRQPTAAQRAVGGCRSLREGEEAWRWILRSCSIWRRRAAEGRRAAFDLGLSYRSRALSSSEKEIHYSHQDVMPPNDETWQFIDLGVFLTSFYYSLLRLREGDPYGVRPPLQRALAALRASQARGIGEGRGRAIFSWQVRVSSIVRVSVPPPPLRNRRPPLRRCPSNTTCSWPAPAAFPSIFRLTALHTTRPVHPLQISLALLPARQVGASCVLFSLCSARFAN